MESEGSSWYNGLEASLTKRLSHGFEFLASYTFSKTWTRMAQTLTQHQAETH